MAKIINISDKLSLSKPCIQVGDKQYTVDDSLETVMKFEEVYDDGDTQGMLECMKLAVGGEAYSELAFEKMSLSNIKVWFLAIIAAMQDMTYEEADARFRQFDNSNN